MKHVETFLATSSGSAARCGPGAHHELYGGRRGLAGPRHPREAGRDDDTPQTCGVDHAAGTTHE
ncbi:MAG TPA: hypothetical protein VF642_02145 [Propionibacteriaceae bacterium]